MESPRVASVGVGEATVPTLVKTFEFLGLDEREWMPRYNATFKTAIRFDQWTTSKDGKASSYFPERHGINPFTTATAQNAGWTWDIPLFNRRGCGYVYCSEFETADVAEQVCRSFFGDAVREDEIRRISIRTGRHRRAWVRNCVASVSRVVSSSRWNPRESFSSSFSSDNWSHFFRTGMVRRRCAGSTTTFSKHTPRANSVLQPRQFDDLTASQLRKRDHLSNPREIRVGEKRESGHFESG